MRRRPAWHQLTLSIALLAAACAGDRQEPVETHPAIVVGIDGASWNAIQDLWSRGQLPHLRQLSEEGVTAELKPVAAESPVIWTSMATGVRPARHGITNFVVPSAAGDVPVSSRARRVPAIWNMASRLDRRVFLLGWWASWPAEPINGIVISDRAMRQVEDVVWPPDYANTLENLVSQERQSRGAPARSTIERQDRLMAAAAIDLAGQGGDLLMLYLRNVDAESHPHWKYFRPQDFDRVDPDQIERLGRRVPASYEEVDRVIGELRARCDPNTQFFIVSDHGFRPVKKEQYRITLDLDRVLEHLGYLVHTESGIDWSQSRAVTWDSAPGMRIKLVRFALTDRQPTGPVSPADLERLRDRLSTALGKITYDTGAPAFRVREPRGEELGRGADLTVVIQQSNVSRALEYRGEQISGAISGLHEITGTHDANTEGIFIAAGPDIDPEAEIDLVHSLDITPTLLYALGLPVAQDFDGRPRTELFTHEFRRTHPVRTIESWGTRETGTATTSEADEQLMEELRALGYLD